MCGRIESRSVNNCVSENLNREVSANLNLKKKISKKYLNAFFFFDFALEKGKFMCELWRNSVDILKERVKLKNWKF